ncbi:MAG: rRNA methyltransferase [Planctomycetaceae bacterium]|nr:rRNA methyltransferase [Planctomycetaceae bacterium]
MPHPDFLEYLRSSLTDNRNRRFDEIVARRTRHLTVVLENTYQPYNASAVLRSCDAFGVQDVHVVEREVEFHVDGEIDLGASKWLCVHRYAPGESATSTCIATLKAQGYQIVASSPHAPDDARLEDYDVTPKTALMLGGELRGLSDDALELADAHLKIPMFGFTESFNLSVSAAVMLQHLTSRLRSSDAPWRLTAEEQHALLFSWTRKSLPKRFDALRKRWEAETGLSADVEDA